MIDDDTSLVPTSMRDMGALHDDPVAALVSDDPYATLAAWDIARDQDFYVGLPNEELEEALAGLYTLSEAPPDFVDRGELQGVIDHVEGLLGIGARGARSGGFIDV